jgi:2-deoxy-D-gluconate 3-dehydrogenase
MSTIPLTEILSQAGKVAIVTGGAKGIGRAIVGRFAEAGARLVIADVDEESGRKAASDVSGDFVLTDMSRESDILNLVRHTVSRHGRVDVLVNNAGIYPFQPALEMTAEFWDRVQSVNLRGLFLLCREFAKEIREQGGGGVIVNIGSIDSLHPSSVGLAAYDASKGGVLMFTRNFALEVAPLGIRVNMIAPGGVTTEGVSEAQRGMPEEMMQQFLARVALGRWGEPDDVATMALVLATPISAYVTGATFVVDGGRLLS